MKITIEVEVEEITGYYLRQAIAAGNTTKGEEVEISSIIPSGDLYFKIGEKHYLVEIQGILSEILKVRGET